VAFFGALRPAVLKHRLGPFCVRIQWGRNWCVAGLVTQEIKGSVISGIERGWLRGGQRSRDRETCI